MVLPLAQAGVLKVPHKSAHHSKKARGSGLGGLIPKISIVAAVVVSEAPYGGLFTQDVAAWFGLGRAADGRNVSPNTAPSIPRYLLQRKLRKFLNAPQKIIEVFHLALKYC